MQKITNLGFIIEENSATETKFSRRDPDSPWKTQVIVLNKTLRIIECYAIDNVSKIFMKFHITEPLLGAMIELIKS